MRRLQEVNESQVIKAKTPLVRRGYCRSAPKRRKEARNSFPATYGVILQALSADRQLRKLSSMELLANLLPAFRLVTRQPRAKKRVSGRKTRRGSAFVRDASIYRQCFDRNQKHRILRSAEIEERKTKTHGLRMGSFGRSGLDLFRCLLIELADAKGLRAPSITRIMAVLKMSRQTVVDALARLERAGRIKRIRRLKRVVNEHGVALCVQDNNIYIICGPGAESSQWKGTESYLKTDRLSSVDGSQGFQERKEDGSHRGRRGSPGQGIMPPNFGTLRGEY